MPLLSLAEARAEREKLRADNRRLVFTNGHFELLHLGHLRYLQAARALGDALFVGVNGDESTRRLKGRGGALVPADERATLVTALRPVTAAIIFVEETACSLIEALRPEIYVKGGDYSASAAGRPAKPLPERATRRGLWWPRHPRRLPGFVQHHPTPRANRRRAADNNISVTTINLQGESGGIARATGWLALGNISSRLLGLGPRNGPRQPLRRDTACGSPAHRHHHPAHALRFADWRQPQWRHRARLRRRSTSAKAVPRSGNWFRCS